LSSSLRSRLIVSGITNAALDAARGANHRQANAGIAGSRLQHDGIRANLAGGDCGIEHGHGDAILDAMAGVEELQLGGTTVATQPAVMRLS
jgi:hypothetical protein